MSAYHSISEFIKATLKHAFVGTSKQNISRKIQRLTIDLDRWMKLLSFGATWVNFCDESFENSLAKCKKCLQDCVG